MSELNQNKPVVEKLLVDLLQAGQTVRFIALGQSMLPLVQNGAVVVVKPCGTNRPPSGELVLCLVSGDDPTNPQILVHRLLAYLPDNRLLTRGDNCLYADPPTRLLGQVIEIEQSERRANLTKPGWRLLNQLIGHTSRVQLSLIHHSEPWLVVTRKAATALYHMLLKIAWLGFQR